jgi:mannose-6-phosphate isomerase-like protein (cupin superfamily)
VFAGAVDATFAAFGIRPLAASRDLTTYRHDVTPEQGDLRDWIKEQGPNGAASEWSAIQADYCRPRLPGDIRRRDIFGRPRWTDSGPSYLHIHRSDDEAWPVLEGSLRFMFPDREVDAPAGTTVFVPAGSPHTYRVTGPSRYLIFLTPRLDRLIARLRNLADQSDLRATLAEFDTVMVE